MDINRFSDLTADEFGAQYLSPMLEDSSQEYKVEEIHDEELTDVPNAFTWKG